MLQVVFLCQIILSALMTGIIWIIQLVHYPSFQYIKSSAWEAFHQFHTSRMRYIVAPLMIMELASSFYLYYEMRSTGFIFILNILIWLSTFLIQVPLHKKLSSAYSLKQSALLTQSNWIRTVLWTLKTAGLLCLINEVV